MEIMRRLTMKKTKSLSKILVAALAVSMVAGSSVMSVFAANTVVTENADNNAWVGSDYVDATHPGTAIRTVHTITVTNVQDTVNSQSVAQSSTPLDVTAYQIVKGTYKDGKLTGYVLCDPTNATMADMEAPTVSEITTIANNIRSNTTTLKGIKMKQGTGAQSNQYTANVEAGLYVVLAKDANATVFNPAIVAVNIDDANDIDDEGAGNDGLTKPIGDPATQVDYTSVNLASYWEIPTRAYLKSSTTSFNKDITGAQNRAIVDPENTEGDIVAKGDHVYFKLDGMTIPSYSDDYAQPGTGENGVIYKIEDKLDGNSFAGINNMTVKTVVGNDKTDVPAANYTISYKNASGNTVTGDAIGKTAVSYTIQFADAWLRANAEKGVEITYDSTLTEDAYVNYQANKTVATLSYTVDPSDNTGVEVLRDSTYHYTFELGGNVDGTTNSKVDENGTEVDPYDNYELNKVTEALGAGENYTPNATTHEYSSTSALAGAEFTLYDDAAFQNPHQMWSRNATTGAWESADAVYTTTDNGHIVFSGLDTGTYYLKETAAPDGYTLNDNDYQVIIEGTIADGTGNEEKGTLTSYTVTIKVKGENGYNDIVGQSTVSVNNQAVTKPDTDANATNFDTVVNTLSVVTNPAEVVDTELAVLPATGGAGTIAITVGASIGMAGFLTLYIVSKKKKKNEE